MDFYLELIAVLLSLVYLGLLIKENILCWLFGISASLLSILLFYRVGLYSESILYTYYVAIGIYGFVLWSKKEKNIQVLNIGELDRKYHYGLIALGLFLAFTLGYIFDNFTDATNPYLDASTTLFSFIASYLEARKILSAWLYWIIINTSTLILYADQGLMYYFILTIIYIVFSVLGYLQWKKKMTRSLG